MELILHFSVHYANIRVFCETTKFLVEFLLHAQAVIVAIFINVRKTALSDCLPIFFRLTCPPLAKRGSLTHSQALALSKRARDVTSMLLRRFFPTTPSLLHKEGSTAFPKPFSPQGTRDVTAPPVALNRCALRLAGHQSPRQFFYAGWDRKGGILIKWFAEMRPQGGYS